MRLFIILLIIFLLVGCVSKETGCMLVKTGINIGLPLALDSHVSSMKSTDEAKKYIDLSIATLSKTIIPKLKDGKSIVGMAQIDELLEILQKDMGYGEKMAIQTGINFVLQSQINGQNKSWDDVIFVAACFFDGILNVFQNYNFPKLKQKYLIVPTPLTFDKGFVAKWKIINNLQDFKK